MSTEGKEMREYYTQPEDEATITSILRAVFPAEKEEEITASPTKLDEVEFEPLVEEGELPSIPTEEELIKYPDWNILDRKCRLL